jgi:hypothetical protein
LIEQTGNSRAAGAAVRSGAKRFSDLGNGGQLLAGNRAKDRGRADIEADAHDWSAFRRSARSPAGEDRWTLPLAELRDQPVARRQLACRSDE